MLNRENPSLNIRLGQRRVLILTAMTMMIFTCYSFTNLTLAFQGLSNEPVWKIFKDRNNLFTVQYLSDWIPNYAPESAKAGPIDIYFDSPDYSDVSGVTIEFIEYDAKSAFNSARESLEAEINHHKNDQALSKFEVEQPIECSKYILNGIQACSYIYEIRDENGNSAVIAVDAISDDGTEYESYYLSSFNSFKQYVPIFDKMIKSFQTIENSLVTPDFIPDNESIDNLNATSNTTNGTSSGEDDFTLD